MGLIVPPYHCNNPIHEGYGPCQITGDHEPKYGPYLIVMGKCFSRAGIVELAKELGLMTSGAAQTRLERMAKDIAGFRSQVTDQKQKLDLLTSERESLALQLEGAKATASQLAAELEETRTLAAIADEYLSPKQPAKTG